MRMVTMKVFRSNKRIVFISITLIFVILILLFHRNGNQIDDRDRRTRLAKIDEFIKSHEGSGSCKLPNLPVNSPEMMHFVKNEPLVDCSSAEPDWVIVKDSTCIITKQAMWKYGTISCIFIDLIRVNDYHTREGSTTYIVNSSYTLKASDVVKVYCKASEKEWQAILTGIREDPAIMKRASWDNVPSNSLKLNVLMFGFDSLSRNTFIRKLPKSYKYLTEVLGSQVLEGYNIVGDGTPQALIPILTGQTELELPDTRKRVSGSSTVDLYPFVWKDFAKNGYVTGFLEDTPYLGTFTYRLNGFKDAPTDHYMRPYYLASAPFWSRSPRLCYGSIPRHKIMMNYIKHFFSFYKNKPKFLFGFHGELSHDSYNLIGVADDDLLNFLIDFNEGGLLKNTLLVVMADHGHRFADIRNTLQGKQEERLPFFSFTFPQSFRTEHQKIYENFIQNKKRLTTPFDIYTTLKDVLILKNIGPADLSQRSLSLFSQIPEKRSCIHAFIEPHWCACLDWFEIPFNSPVVPNLTSILLNTLNNYTSTHRELCEILTIKKLIWVTQISPNDNLLRFRKNADIDGFIADLTADMKMNSNLYQIKAELQPGNSLFEASITHYIKENKFVLKLSDISRTNMYGKQARCIENSFPHLRKYCYCKDGL